MTMSGLESRTTVSSLKTVEFEITEYRSRSGRRQGSTIS